MNRIKMEAVSWTPFLYNCGLAMVSMDSRRPESVYSSKYIVPSSRKSGSTILKLADVKYIQKANDSEQPLLCFVSKG